MKNPCACRNLQCLPIEILVEIVICIAKNRQQTFLMPKKGMHQASKLFLFVHRYITILEIKINHHI